MDADRAARADETPRREPPSGDAACDARPACPVCGGSLIEIRAKFQCAECHRICETCCEGGRG